MSCMRHIALRVPARTLLYLLHEQPTQDDFWRTTGLPWFCATNYLSKAEQPTAPLPYCEGDAPESLTVPINVAAINQLS